MNTIEQTGAATDFDLASYAVSEDHFQLKIDKYEETYRVEFPGGWRHFYAVYSLGLADNANLDYDEWAFLCERFLIQEPTYPCAPPGECVASCHEKPETTSGFSFAGEIIVRPTRVFRENPTSSRCNVQLGKYPANAGSQIRLR